MEKVESTYILADFLVQCVSDGKTGDGDGDGDGDGRVDLSIIKQLSIHFAWSSRLVQLEVLVLALAEHDGIALDIMAALLGTEE